MSEHIAEPGSTLIDRRVVHSTGPPIRPKSEMELRSHAGAQMENSRRCRSRPGRSSPQPTLHTARSRSRRRVFCGQQEPECSRDGGLVLREARITFAQLPHLCPVAATFSGPTAFSAWWARRIRVMARSQDMPRALVSRSGTGLLSATEARERRLCGRPRFLGDE